MGAPIALEPAVTRRPELALRTWPWVSGGDDRGWHSSQLPIIPAPSVIYFPETVPEMPDVSIRRDGPWGVQEQVWTSQAIADLLDVAERLSA